jgi:hypothetical protein
MCGLQNCRPRTLRLSESMDGLKTPWDRAGLGHIHSTVFYLFLNQSSQSVSRLARLFTGEFKGTLCVLNTMGQRASREKPHVEFNGVRVRY